MPIPITAASARSLAHRLDGALAQVRHEFEGLDRHRQYSRAFGRLMKPDRLGQVLVLGMDARDLFVPVLREVIGRVVGSGGQVLDLGGGDGRTFALLAERLPEGTVVSAVEPNPAALRDYAEFLAAEPHLVPGALLEVAFIQGKRGAWHCGAHTLINSQETCFVSGLAAARQIGADYPFDDPEARRSFNHYGGIMYGWRLRKVRG